MSEKSEKTSDAEQQAAPKAAPGEQDDHQILAITTAYEQGVGKGHQAYNSGKEIANPYSPAYRCDLAWQYGYKEGKEQAQREAKPAPQHSPTAQADSVPAVEREQERIAFKDAHRHLDLDEVPDAWGRPMFKHSHVEASWLGWVARASHGQAPAQTADSQLLRFYGVTTDAELIAAQAAHIEKLQARLTKAAFPRF